MGEGILREKDPKGGVKAVEAAAECERFGGAA